VCLPSCSELGLREKEGGFGKLKKPPAGWREQVWEKRLSVSKKVKKRRKSILTRFLKIFESGSLFKKICSLIFQDVLLEFYPNLLQFLKICFLSQCFFPLHPYFSSIKLYTLTQIVTSALV